MGQLSAMTAKTAMTITLMTVSLIENDITTDIK